MRGNIVALTSALSFGLLAIAPAQAQEAGLTEMNQAAAMDPGSHDQLGNQLVTTTLSAAVSAEFSAKMASVTSASIKPVSDNVQFDLAQTNSFGHGQVGPSASASPLNLVSGQGRDSYSAEQERVINLHGPKVQTAVRVDLNSNAKAAFGDEIAVESGDRFDTNRLDNSVILNQPLQFRAPAKVKITL